MKTFKVTYNETFSGNESSTFSPEKGNVKKLIEAEEHIDYTSTQDPLRSWLRHEFKISGETTFTIGDIPYADLDYRISTKVEEI